MPHNPEINMSYISCLVAAALFGAVTAQPDAQCNTYVLPYDQYYKLQLRIVL